jgi:flavorubredoxin
MSQTYAVPVDREHTTVSFDHEFLNVLRSRNLKLDVEELYSVGTIRHGSDESSGYLLAVVSHLTAPLDEVDVVNQERKETAVCGCSGWYHHAYDQEIGAKVGDCKHTERVKELRGTEMPDDQATLV